MRRDPTQFRERFKRWKLGLPAYLGGRPVEDELFELFPKFGHGEIADAPYYAGNVLGDGNVLVVTGKKPSIYLQMAAQHQKSGGYHSAFNGDALRDVLGFVPYVSDTMDGVDAAKALSLGDPTLAVILGGGLIIPNVLEKPLYFGKKYLKRFKNLVWPDTRYRPVMLQRDYTKVEQAALTTAQDVAWNFGSGGDYLIRVGGDIENMPARFSQSTIPQQITIGNNVVPVNTRRIFYHPGQQILKPKYGTDDVTHVFTTNEMFLPTAVFAEGNSPLAKTFDVSNDIASTKALADHVKEVLELSGSPVVGSGRLISEGFFGGVPGDIEIVTTRQNLDDVQKKLGFLYARDTRGGTGVTGSSPKVLKSSESNNLDINILDDTGTIIHQMESTRKPDKMPPLYSELATNKASGKSRLLPLETNSKDLRIPKENGTGDYTADEYFDLIKTDQKLLTQSVVDNAFKSGNEKHVKRAIVMMNDSRPEVVLRVSTAIDHMYAQIPGAKKFSETYLAQNYNDVTKNKEILEKIGFPPFDVDKFASNPEQMKNIIDYWYMRKTIGTRSVNYVNRTGGDSFENVMSAVRLYDNGSSAGGGGNTVLGSTFGGYTREYTSYNNYHPVVDRKKATFDDVYDAFKREETIFNDKDAVKSAIQKVVDKVGLSINDFSNFNSKFTDDVNDLVRSGKLNHDEANYIITQIAKELKVSGYRGHQYRDYGDYFGAMLNTVAEIGEPGIETAYRNIDSPQHNQPVLPAEWGSDEMFFGKTKPHAISPYSKLTTLETNAMPMVEAAEKYPNNVIDMVPYRKKAVELQAKKDASGTMSLIKLNKGYDVDVIEDAVGIGYAKKRLADKEAKYSHRVKQRDKIISDRYKRARATRAAMGGISAAIGTAGLGSGVGWLLGSIKLNRDFLKSEEFHLFLSDPNSDPETNPDFEKVYDEYYNKFLENRKKKRDAIRKKYKLENK